MNQAWRLQELERRLNNLLMVGTILEVDYAAARCRVEIGELRTAWLKWFTTRASSDRSWWAPEVGEQVMVLSPSGELAQGTVLPAIYQSAHPAPGDRATHRIDDYGDGTRVTYDRAASVLTIDCVGDVVIENANSITVNTGTTLDITAGGSATLTAPDVTVDSPQSIFTGQVTIQGPLIYQSGMTGSGGSGASASITGGISVTSGDVTADGVSLKSHTHPGDSGGTTGPPN